jgi:hypothetical protein
LEEVELVLRLIKEEELESRKIVILISSPMVWANTPQKTVKNPEFNPDVEGSMEFVPTPYTEVDYTSRKASPRYEGYKFVENYLLSLQN